MKNLPFLYVCIDIILLAALYQSGVMGYIISVDVSYISLLIFILYFGATNVLLFMLRERTRYLHSAAWFLVNSFMVLGMLGTVVGFMFMLSGIFTGADFTNIEAVKGIMVQMASGMGTALTTTAAGLVASLLASIKLVVSDHA